jgi:hypothetical protein
MMKTGHKILLLLTVLTAVVHLGTELKKYREA